MNTDLEYLRLGPDVLSASVGFDEPAGWILVVRIRGALDIATVPPLRTVLDRRLRSSRPCRLVLDLTTVTLLSSAALRLLIELHRGARIHDRHLILTGIGNPVVHRPLRMSGLLALFDTRPTVEHALTGSTLPRATPLLALAFGPQPRSDHPRSSRSDES